MVGQPDLSISKRMEELKSVLHNYTFYRPSWPMLAWEFVNVNKNNNFFGLIMTYPELDFTTLFVPIHYRGTALSCFRLEFSVSHRPKCITAGLNS